MGSCARQIAKINGCRSVGITGGAAKAQLCTEAFGYDAAIECKADDLDLAPAAACPDGVDICFDNTAGAISDTVLKHLAVGGRVIVCGTDSVASCDPPFAGPRVERHLLVKLASMQGMLVFDHGARLPAAIEELSKRVIAGSLRYCEDILYRIEQAPGAIAGLYRGENLGKRPIRLAERDT